MAAMVEPAPSSSALIKDEKPVVVRVKRKNFQSPLEGFWLEINERPVKRPLVDFQKLSLDNSSSKVEELKPKKVFVQRVETVRSSDVAVDILQSFVASKPAPADALADALETKVKLEDRRRGFRTVNKQDQLLTKAKEKQEILAKNARFQQIWKSRKGKGGTMPEDSLRDICQLYDVVRVDVEEMTGDAQKQEDANLEEQRLMSTFLPLLQEFIPSAAEEVESEINYQNIKRASKDDYVYDLYAVKDDHISMTADDTKSPFPLVQVDDEDFYDGPDNSDYDTDDSNAEDNPMNDYPEEEEEEEEEEQEEDDDSEKSDEDLEEEDSSKPDALRYHSMFEEEMIDNDEEEDDETYW